MGMEGTTPYYCFRGCICMRKFIEQDELSVDIPVDDGLQVSLISTDEYEDDKGEVKPTPDEELFDIPGQEPSEDLISLYTGAIESEQEAIDIYQNLLQQSDLTQFQRDVINEILGDEKDHIVKLSDAIGDVVQGIFPDYGED